MTEAKPGFKRLKSVLYKTDAVELRQRKEYQLSL
jgi:hypothetical protein